MKIDLKLEKTKPFNKHFQYCVGADHAKQALRKDYLDHLKFVHDTLGIERVRFHGLFDDDMNVVRRLSDILPIPGAERFQDVNFHVIGDVYDQILATGMKPFVELGFMPTHMAKDKSKQLMFYYHACDGMPKDDEEWASFIQSFVRFLLDRYGAEEVESWSFEVWNEPDLIVFFGDAQEDYFHLYEITSRAIKEVDPKLCVGGPATSGSHWIPEFLAFVKKNNVPLDFISTHQYAGDPIGNIDGNDLEQKEPGANASPFANPNLFKDVPSGRVLDGIRRVFVDKSETQDIPNNSILVNAAQVRNVCGDLPLYYTEWNENATFSAATNDTRKVSAFIVMTSLKLEGTVNGSSVWCHSDVGFEELHPFGEEFHGGFGLLTNHGIPKPSYYALRFLHDVGNQRYDIPVDFGEITVAAFQKEDGSVQLLLTRQKMKNLALEPMEIELSLNDLGFSSAAISSIDEEHGNPLKIFQSMGSPLYLKKEEVEQIKEKSQVSPRTLPMEKKDGKVCLRLCLGVNDTVLIDLR